MSHIEIIDAVMDGERRYILLAHGPAGTSGYCEVRQGDKKVLWLQTIYVKEELRRQGTGRSLVERCLGLAERDGKEGMSLYVRKANEEALEFYASLRFRIVYDYDDRDGYMLHRSLAM